MLQAGRQTDNNRYGVPPPPALLTRLWERYSRERVRSFRPHLRVLVVLALAAGLLTLFLHDVNIPRMVADIAHARPEWLALSLASMFVNLAIRAWRWKYLLEPLGRATFSNAFRATAVGFAASSLLPARAG